MAKENNKTCPLTFVVGKGAYDQEVTGRDRCTGIECAWWNWETGECSILAISRFCGRGTWETCMEERKSESEILRSQKKRGL